MGRKYRAHDERRNAILDGAWELFASRGYEGTTVAAIIERLDISKGTFYHYFTSKEEVLNAITDRLSVEALAALQPIVENTALEAGPKFNLYMETARRSRLRRIDAIIDVARVLYREENLIIRHKINERLYELAIAGLITIIDQGIDEGAFQVIDAGEAARFVWHLSNTFADLQMNTLLGDTSVDGKVSEMVRRADFACQSIERVLGAEPDTLAKPSPEILKLFVQAVTKDGVT